MGPLEEDMPLRELYQREMGCQVVHDSLPGRGFGDLFLIRLDGYSGPETLYGMSRSIERPAAREAADATGEAR
jgi:hypothetical protein